MSTLTTDEYSEYLPLHAGGPPYRARAELPAARTVCCPAFRMRRRARPPLHAREHTPADDCDGAQAYTVRDGAQLDAVDGKGCVQYSEYPAVRIDVLRVV